MTMGRALGVALVVIAVMAGTAQAAVPPDRYGFAHGCYSLQDESAQLIAPASGPFRMQATTLGEYLLYGVHRRLPRRPRDRYSDTCRGAQHGSGMEGHRQPERRLHVEEHSHEQCHPGHLPLGDRLRRLSRGLDRGGGWAPPRTRRSSGPVYGFADAHMHWTGFRLFGSAWHCGRPWHKYGIAYAMPDCAQYDQGTNGQVRAFIDGRVPGQPYDTVGWPTFGYWPGPTRQAEEGTYYTSVERAWLGGLRLLVVLFVDNEALCDAMTFRDPAPPGFCNDMDSVRQQNQDLEDFEDYVDAQNGGPGKGWLRIVTSPARARKVIDQGKLAVVKGIELSRVLDCGETVASDPEPQCDQAHVDAGLDELQDMGITSFFPVHKFDNAFGGTKMDSGALGPVVNAGNFYKTQHFWHVHQCTGPGEDREQPTVPIGANVASAHRQSRPAPADVDRPDLRPAAALQPARSDGHRRIPDQRDDRPALHHRGRPHGELTADMTMDIARGAPVPRRHQQPRRLVLRPHDRADPGGRRGRGLQQELEHGHGPWL